MRKPALLASVWPRCLAFALCATSAHGQSPDVAADIEAMCPDAVREAIELKSRLKPPQVSAPPTRPALRENLLLMVKQDQEARAASGLAFDPANPAVMRMIEIDAANLRRLKHIVDQDGFPDARMVGLDGVKAAWLLTLHAAGDVAFLEKVLRLTTGHVRRGEVSGNDVAMLTDDLLDARGKPQRYGTNFVSRDGELKPAPMEDEANVDERRRAAGLGTLANYACVLRATYGIPSRNQ